MTWKRLDYLCLWKKNNCLNNRAPNVTEKQSFRLFVQLLLWHICFSVKYYVHVGQWITWKDKILTSVWEYGMSRYVLPLFIYLYSITYCNFTNQFYWVRHRNNLYTLFWNKQIRFVTGIQEWDVLGVNIQDQHLSNILSP